ncbi:hypothetical protein ACH5RR_012643 [Cinchona calisaya]|uniref:Uncharacterized protein n=1 Tax=Cinchona calisaya TaxID=153742 RepID=A0ABD3ABX5_9GENT
MTRTGIVTMMGENVVSFTRKKKSTKLEKGDGKSMLSAVASDAIGDNNDKANGDSLSEMLSNNNDDEPIIAFLEGQSHIKIYNAFFSIL